jgi:hypothetical protein
MNRRILLYVMIFFILAGLTGLIAFIVVTPDFAIKYLSVDHNITKEGYAFLSTARLVSLILGLLLFLFGLINILFPSYSFEKISQISILLDGYSNKAKLFFVAASAIFLLTVSVAILNNSGQGNLYVHQAQAFLKGHLDVPKEFLDVSVHKGKYYVPFPPFPAVLLMPFIALFGAVNTTLVALILSFLNVYMFMRVLNKLNVEQNSILWLTLAFFLGTGYWLAVKWRCMVFRPYSLSYFYAVFHPRSRSIRSRGYCWHLFGLLFSFPSTNNLQLDFRSSCFVDEST